MKSHHGNADNQEQTTLTDKWPERGAPTDARGLPGYPGRGGPAGRDVDPELGFNPDSPDLGDPQIDPPHPPHIPDSTSDPRAERRAPDDRYPPYDDK